MRKLLQSLFILMFVSFTALAQERTITGTVTAKEDGLPLPGVGVKIKGATGGVATTENGKFSINAGANATLVFTSIGYLTTEVAIGNRSVVDVQMLLDAKALDEVIIQVPYGTVKKSAFTGAESTVNAGTLAKTQVTSLQKALEGQIAGIVATNGGGQPGSGASILVRGVGSVNASSSPLYVVNGAPYNGSIASLSMDDIESVTVLKDAAASSLYGSRAANGVVMIQTKSGKRGETQITVNARTGLMNRGIPQYDFVNQQEYYEMMWEATRNRLVNASGQTPAVAGANASDVITGPNGLVYNAYNVPGKQLIDPVTGKLNPNAQLLWNDSWNDVLFQTARRQDYNFNISGASDKTDFFLSAGYVNEEGVTKFTDYERFTTRLNLNTQARTWLKAGVSLDGSLSEQRNNVNGGTATTNPFYYSTMMGPIYPVYQRTASGDYIVDPTTGKNTLDWGKASQMGLRPYGPNSNLLGSLDLDDRSTRPVNVNALTYVEATILKDFKFRPSISTTFYDANTTTFQNSLFGDADNVSGRSTKSNNRQLTYTLSQVLSYNKKFGEHTVTALAGHENFFFRQNVVSATRTGFPFPGSSELASAAVAEASTSYQNDHAIEGYFTQASYDYQDKYYLSGSFRADGSSRFSQDARWGNFYSVGAAWRLSQEAFLKGSNWINELKLRASYGELGNESLGTYYAYQALYSLGWNNVNFPGATVSTLPNLDLRWEKNVTANIGVDFALFNNRLQGSVEVYDKLTSDMLFDVPLAISTGITSITTNIGTLRNRGADVTLGYNAFRGDKFGWRVDLNLTHFKNKFVKLPQEEIISGTKKFMVGKSIYEWWIRDFAGVDPANGDALYYKDVLGTDGLPTGERTTTNNITQGSFYYKGTALADLTGGLTNSFRYGNFDLSFMFTFQLGGKYYDGNYASLMHPGAYGTNWHKDILNRWTTPGQITDVPRVQNALSTQAGTSSRYLFDATYLNLKNVTFGYRLPTKWATAAGIRGAKLFTNIDNAYLWTKGRKGMDPQRSLAGNSDFTYPISRTFTFGLNVNF